MSRRAPSTHRSTRTETPRPTAMDRVARVSAEFEVGRHNPFASVDLSRLSPEARARAAKWQRERGFTPSA